MICILFMKQIFFWASKCSFPNINDIFLIKANCLLAWEGCSLPLTHTSHQTRFLINFKQLFPHRKAFLVQTWVTSLRSLSSRVLRPAANADMQWDKSCPFHSLELKAPLLKIEPRSQNVDVPLCYLYILTKWVCALQKAFIFLEGDLYSGPLNHSFHRKRKAFEVFMSY